MRKRISIFAGLLAVLVGAIAFAAMGTGAYFSDEASGTVTANSGQVKITQVGTQSLNQDWGTIMPGNPWDQTKTVTIRNDSGRQVHMYLRGGAPTGLDDLTPVQKSQLAVTYDQDGFAPGPYGFFKDFGPVNAGESVKVDVSLGLNSSAGNEWKNRSISIPLTVIANQVEAPVLNA